MLKQDISTANRIKLKASLKLMEDELECRLEYLRSMKGRRVSGL